MELALIDRGLMSVQGDMVGSVVKSGSPGVCLQNGVPSPGKLPMKQGAGEDNGYPRLASRLEVGHPVVQLPHPLFSSLQPPQRCVIMFFLIYSKTEAWRG